MEELEQNVIADRSEKLRNVCIVAVAYAASALLYKFLFHEGLGHSSLLFIGLPGVLAILLALAPRAGTAKGGIIKGITLALLILAPLLGEGYLCILMASPLFYAIGLIVGAGIDASRNKPTTLSCAAVLVAVLVMDGFAPAHDRRELVSVTRILPLSEATIQERLGEPIDIATPLPRFLRLGFPRPIAVSGTGLSVGSVRTVRFSGAEGDPPGDLTLQIKQRDAQNVLFFAVGDNSKLTQWIAWRSCHVEWQAVDPTHTRVTWQTTFDRQLDPWWYFAPWERYAVRKATEYLLVANTSSNPMRGQSR